MPGTEIYEYRFQVGSRRYRASTGVTSEREALRIERAAKEAAKREQILHGKQPSGQGMALKSAVGKYLHIQAQKSHINQATFNVEVEAFKWIVATIGPDVLMSDLDTEMVARMVAEKGKRGRTNSQGKVLLDADGKPQPLSNSYVNRYTWRLLKRVYLAARDEWGVPVKPIKWSSDRIFLAENSARKREIKFEEEHQIIADKNFREGYGSAFKFNLLAGMRKENFTNLQWSQIDFGHREIHFNMKGRKGRKSHTIKIDDEMLAILVAERGKHPVYVFTYICQRTRKNPKTGVEEVKGERRPITYSGFTSWYRKLVGRLGFDVTIHDIRRTTGSRIVRSTGNLKAASGHLGHSDITITAKHYAHIQTDEMLAILNKRNDGTKDAKEALTKLFDAGGVA
ncbi:tyrosine-type recombinase/integrase [Microvirga calopogonii]|uniref:tyrosine-type recombinase/integrase n=1 Tax=Microvirga calopogonii TaxID=2078013 RepID=UPI000E0D466B|nr:tyrosine-type recombinase/integrase [Microvirga calopogonii]